MLAASAFHRSYHRWRCSVLCILLSAAVVSLGLLFVLTPFNLSHLYSHFMLFWCVAFFAAGIVCSIYYRIIFSVFILCGIVSFGSYYILKRKYPLPRKSVLVAVSNGSFSSDAFSEKLFLDSSGVSCIALDVCTLPPELLLPFSRRWYAFHKTSGSSDLSDEENIILYHLFNMYTSYMTGDDKTVYIPVSVGAGAAVYTLDCRSESPVLVRVL